MLIIGPGSGQETNRGADTQTPTGSPVAAASTVQTTATDRVTTATGSAAAADPATTTGVAYPATSTSHGTSTTPASGTSGILGTNANQSNFQKNKKTSDVTAQTDPLQKNIFEKPKNLFNSMKVPTGVKNPIQSKTIEGPASSKPDAIPSKTYTAII